MRSRFMMFGWASLAAAWLALPAFAQEGEVRAVALAKVPALVRAAASKEMPRAKFTGATAEVKDGQVLQYVLAGKDAGSKGVQVILAPNGTVMIDRLEVAMAEVPKAFADKLAAEKDDRLAGFKPEKAEKMVMRQIDDATDYVYTGKNAKGEWVEARVGGQDRIVSTIVLKEEPKAGAAEESAGDQPKAKVKAKRRRR